jgi:hypothetical protein
MRAHHITNPNPPLLTTSEWLESRAMYDNQTNKSAPKSPRCLNCARPMQLLRRTSRFGRLLDLYSFYCVTCDEWHVEEGDAVTDQRPQSQDQLGSVTKAAQA